MGWEKAQASADSWVLFPPPHLEAGVTNIPIFMQDWDLQQTNFFFLKTGFHHAGQAGLELPTYGDLPTSASQSAGITGMSHRTQASFPYFYF